MGQVFTFEDIRLDRIPHKEDLAAFVAKFERAIYGSSAFAAAVVYGSTKHGTYSVRSDFDALVVYKKEEEECALEHVIALHKLAREWYIPLNVQIIDTELAKTRHHQFYNLYCDHVQVVAEREGFIKGNPMRYITPATTDKKADARNHMGTKIGSLLNAYTSGESRTAEQTALFLQKLLEAPIHAARKVLHCYDELPWPDDKKSVVESYLRVFGGVSNAPTLLSKLVEVDYYYTDSLYRQINNPNEQLYKELLCDIEMISLPPTLKFLRICMDQIEALGS